jgi:hypothetical protein
MKGLANYSMTQIKETFGLCSYWYQGGEKTLMKLHAHNIAHFTCLMFGSH